MAQLFEVTVPTVNEDLKNIFESGKIENDAVVRKFRITAKDGKSYDTKHYNLDAIISVDYRVNSVRATQFRQWATGILRDFAIRGYVLDHKRKEASETPWTKDLWIYDLRTNQHFTLKTNPLVAKDLVDFIKVCGGSQGGTPALHSRAASRNSPTTRSSRETKPISTSFGSKMNPSKPLWNNSVVWKMFFWSKTSTSGRTLAQAFC